MGDNHLKYILMTLYCLKHNETYYMHYSNNELQDVLSILEYGVCSTYYSFTGTYKIWIHHDIFGIFVCFNDLTLFQNQNKIDLCY